MQKLNELLLSFYKVVSAFKLVRSPDKISSSPDIAPSLPRRKVRSPVFNQFVRTWPFDGRNQFENGNASANTSLNSSILEFALPVLL